MTVTAMRALAAEIQRDLGITSDDWKPGPVVPKIPRPRPASDELVQCAGCPDAVPLREIRDHAGWPLCPDCHPAATARTDRHLTRRLAYAA